MTSRRMFLAAGAACVFASAALAQSGEGRLPVVASFSIVGDIVQEIGGGRIALTTLVKPGFDAHVYTPTPADAKAIGEAKLVITNGLGFEGWMRRLQQSTASRAAFVEAAKGVKALEEKTGGHSHGHSHAHGALDPHAWQSVANVKTYAANIRDALIAADPDGTAAYEANAARYIADLEALDADIRAAVARIPIDRRKAITSHDAFGYFQQAYGIAFSAPRGISTESEPSAKDVARIIQQIRREKIAAVFIENLTDPRLMAQIAKESGAKIGGALVADTLTPREQRLPDGSTRRGVAPTYIQMMRHNIRVISEALTPQS
ncbi:MAG: metal ABC transporter solute-binding protein, Zn/Mn family [Beijerinckiaceae bacterium]